MNPKQLLKNSGTPESTTDRTAKDITLDSLAIPLNIFEVIQGAHEGLASKGNDPDIVRIHCEIVELIQKMQEKYSPLDESGYARTKRNPKALSRPRLWEIW